MWSGLFLKSKVGVGSGGFVIRYSSLSFGLFFRLGDLARCLGVCFFVFNVGIELFIYST